MSLPTLFLENQFGEQSENFITGGTNVVATVPIASHTILGNITGSSALAVALTYAQVVTALPIGTKVLTGLATGVNQPIAATDTILTALANLQAQISAL